MSDTTPSAGISKTAAAPAARENRSFNDILESFVGHIVTVVNPESYEGAAVGYQIRSGFYRGKVSALGNDYLSIVTEFQRAGRKADKEPVKQYIPLQHIKRVSMSKSERILHL